MPNPIWAAARVERRGVLDGPDWAGRGRRNPGIPGFGGESDVRARSLPAPIADIDTKIVIMVVIRFREVRISAELRQDGSIAIRGLLLFDGMRPNELRRWHHLGRWSESTGDRLRMRRALWKETRELWRRLTF